MSNLDENKISQELDDSNSTQPGLHKHKFTNKTVAPTCTEKGYVLHKCKICGYEYKDNFVSPAHDFEKTVVDSTCEYDGNIIYTCKVCGEEKVEIIPKKGHDFGEWVEQKHPSCNEFGEQARQCRNCGKIETKTTSKLAHEFGEWRYEGDFKLRDCIHCGYTEKVNLTEEKIKRAKYSRLSSFFSFLFWVGLLLGLGGCSSCVFSGFDTSTDAPPIIGTILFFTGLILFFVSAGFSSHFEEKLKDKEDEKDKKDK